MQDNRYWENDRVQYVEGIGLSKHTARITGHGWIEHDERVVELTWPWHSPLPPEETVSVPHKAASARTFCGLKVCRKPNKQTVTVSRTSLRTDRPP